MVAAPPAARRALWTAAALTALAAGPADAQYMSTNSADFNAGYGRIAGSENHPVDVSTRDANGNRVIIDGIIQRGEDQSGFTGGWGGWGAGDSYSGVGSVGGGSTAIGNNLVVVTQGNYNTVIVNSTQINNGNVTANANVNGGVGGNGQ